MTIQEKVWDFKPASFDVIRLTKMFGKFTPKSHATHPQGNKNHDTDRFHFELADHVTLYWSYCPTCTQIRQKYIIGFDDDFKLAYFRELVKDGEDLVENQL